MFLSNLLLALTVAAGIQLVYAWKDNNYKCFTDTKCSGNPADISSVVTAHGGKVYCCRNGDRLDLTVEAREAYSRMSLTGSFFGDAPDTRTTNPEAPQSPSGQTIHAESGGEPKTNVGSRAERLANEESEGQHETSDKKGEERVENEGSEGERLTVGANWGEQVTNEDKEDERGIKNDGGEGERISNKTTGGERKTNEALHSQQLFEDLGHFRPAAQLMNLPRIDELSGNNLNSILKGTIAKFMASTGGARDTVQSLLEMFGEAESGDLVDLMRAAESCFKDMIEHPRVMEAWGRFLGLIQEDWEKLERELKKSANDLLAGADIANTVTSIEHIVKDFFKVIRDPDVKEAWGELQEEVLSICSNMTNMCREQSDEIKELVKAVCMRLFGGGEDGREVESEDEISEHMEGILNGIFGGSEDEVRAQSWHEIKELGKEVLRGLLESGRQMELGSEVEELTQGIPMKLSETDDARFRLVSLEKLKELGKRAQLRLSHWGRRAGSFQGLGELEDGNLRKILEGVEDSNGRVVEKLQELKEIGEGNLEKMLEGGEARGEMEKLWDIGEHVANVVNGLMSEFEGKETRKESGLPQEIEEQAKDVLGKLFDTVEAGVELGRLSQVPGTLESDQIHSIEDIAMHLFGLRKLPEDLNSGMIDLPESSEVIQEEFYPDPISYQENMVKVMRDMQNKIPNVLLESVEQVSKNPHRYHFINKRDTQTGQQIDAREYIATTEPDGFMSTDDVAQNEETGDVGGLAGAEVNDDWSEAKEGGHDGLVNQWKDARPIVDETEKGLKALEVEEVNEEEITCTCQATDPMDNFFTNIFDELMWGGRWDMPLFR